MSKTFTKTMVENLDGFVSKKNNAVSNSDIFGIDGELQTEVTQRERLVKRSDGLIEKINNKIIISEDNRQYLID